MQIQWQINRLEKMRSQLRKDEVGRAMKGSAPLREAQSVEITEFHAQLTDKKT